MTLPVNETWYPAKGEQNVVGRFGTTKILDIPKSKDADEPVYKDIIVLFTRAIGNIDIPGPIKVLPDNRRDLIARFPEAWEAFSGNLVNVPGTPMDGLEASPDKITEWSLFGVVRLEHLANLSDQQCESMGFGTKAWRAKARMLLGLAEHGVPSNASAVKQSALPQAPQASVLVADVQKMVADAVAAALAAQKAAEPEPKRRGRPPKAQTAEPAAA